jgi:hypothetical protein
LLLFWQCRRQPHFWRNAAWVLVAAPMGAALATRNLLLYGDLTGFNAFERLHRLAAVDTSFMALLHTLVSLPNHLWLVWWKGSDAGSNALLAIFYLIMGVVLVMAWGKLCLHLWQERNHPLKQSADQLQANRRALAFIYLVTVLLYAGAVMSSYYEGMVPVVQGRLLLPAIVPFVLLLVWGLWLLAWRERILPAVVVLLWAMGLFALFGNLIPYFYYWSDVVDGTLRASSTSLRQALQVTWHNSLLDKPAFFAPLFVALPVGYGLTLLYTFVMAVRSMTPPPYRLTGGKYTSVVLNPSEPKSP